MVNEGRGRLFRRKDGKYLIYLPKDMAEDSMFPFRDYEQGKRTGKPDSIHVKVSFKTDSHNRNKPGLLIEEWHQPVPETE